MTVTVAEALLSDEETLLQKTEMLFVCHAVVGISSPLHFFMHGVEQTKLQQISLSSLIPVFLLSALIFLVSNTVVPVFERWETGRGRCQTKINNPCRLIQYRGLQRETGGG